MSRIAMSSITAAAFAASRVTTPFFTKSAIAATFIACWIARACIAPATIGCAFAALAAISDPVSTTAP